MRKEDPCAPSRLSSAAGGGGGLRERDESTLGIARRPRPARGRGALEHTATGCRPVDRAVRFKPHSVARVAELADAQDSKVRSATHAIPASPARSQETSPQV